MSSFDDSCTEKSESAGELPGACTYFTPPPPAMKMCNTLGSYPPMINSASAWQLAQRVAAGIVGEANVQEAEATMGGEDFGYFMRRTPGVFVLLGSGSAALGTQHGVHTPLFKLDEGVLRTGAALHVMFARAALQQLAAEGGGEEL
jgi:metal-dependent amidase/aminoacylase/carboxypeptidase family protein